MEDFYGVVSSVAIGEPDAFTVRRGADAPTKALFEKKWLLPDVERLA
jgi:hypothetical protein